MTTSTPETQVWLLAGVLVTAVQEGAETSVTLTVTTPAAISDARAALATVATALQAAAQERKELQPCRP